jgi:hypothetical protein
MPVSSMQRCGCWSCMADLAVGSALHAVTVSACSTADPLIPPCVHVLASENVRTRQTTM